MKLPLVPHPRLDVSSGWVTVIPGCEECRFIFQTAQYTQAPPLISIYRAESRISEAQDLTPENLIGNQFASQNGTSFDERVWAGLKSGTWYRYRVTTEDADTYGSFATARRQATAQLDSVYINEAGDPSGTGNLTMQFGLHGVSPASVEWHSTGNAGQMYQIASTVFGESPRWVDNNTNIWGNQFSPSSQVNGEVPAYLRVVFYIKDHDQDFSLWGWVGGVVYNDELNYGGGEGRDLYGGPANSARGYDDGEWTRIVQDFVSLPQYPGTYDYSLNRNSDFPNWTPSQWGVIFSIWGNLKISVIPAAQRPTVNIVNTGAGAGPVNYRRLSQNFRQLSLSVGGQKRSLRIGGNGRIYLGRKLLRDRQLWRELDGREVEGLSAFSSRGDTMVLAAADIQNRLLISQYLLDKKADRQLKSPAWIVTGEAYVEPFVPIRDGNEIIGLVFVGPDKDARVLPLKKIRKGTTAISAGGKDMTVLSCLYHRGALHLFGLDSKGSLNYSRNEFAAAGNASWKRLGGDIKGFTVAQDADHAEVIAFSGTGTLRNMRLPLNKTSALKQSRWRPCGTLHKPGVQKLAAAKSKPKRGR